VANLRGPRVVLRPAGEDDIPALEDIRREPAVERWWGVLEDGELAEDLAAENDDVVILAIEVAGDMVGAIQWYQERTPAFRHAGMDIFLTTRVHGRGIGTEAVRLATRFAFERAALHKLEAGVFVGNVASRCIFEKNGYALEGTIRRAVKKRGQFVDDWRFGILREEVLR